MVEKIINTIAEELLIKPEDITPETSLIDDLGADSLDLIEIVMKLEDLYDIQIEDDGEGLDQEKVAEIVRFINTAKPVEGKKNIGIRNVNQRIKLACGEQYGIIIESTPYQGSRFTIQLPIMREGEGNET